MILEKDQLSNLLNHKTQEMNMLKFDPDIYRKLIQ